MLSCDNLLKCLIWPKLNLRVLQTAIDEKLAKKCQNSSLYVPKTDDDLKKAMAKIIPDHPEEPVRIWTDYGGYPSMEDRNSYEKTVT